MDELASDWQIIDALESDDAGWLAAELAKFPDMAKFVFGEMGICHVAAGCGAASCLMALAAHGADVCSPDNQGVTPLMVAAIEGKAGAVEALLSLGANPDAADEAGMTAWMHAVHAGSLEAVKALAMVSDLLRVDNQGRRASDLARTPALRGFVVAAEDLVAAEESAGPAAAARKAPGI